ncbi:MAG: hypothetical protein ABSH20_02820 [Tepidisphaeraceae bacterium]
MFNCHYRRAVLIAVSLAGSSLLASAGRAEEPAAAGGTRYGLFGLLDHRSTYGQGWFVEPLRAPEMDVDREFRVDYFHGEKKGVQTNEVNAELEYNFNLLTVEIEAPYSWEREATHDPITGRTEHDTSEDVGNIELAVRHLIFQYVSANKFFDYTLAAAFELALPSGSSISKDTEFVPQLFQLVRLGEHLSIEASVGLSMLAGPEEGGTNTFEYNLVLGYNLEHKDLPIPGVMRTIPIFELNGERVLSGEDDGTNRLFGTAGLRLNFNSVGPVQPRIGVGYVFPIDSGARDEMRWGIITSFVLEF